MPAEEAIYRRAVALRDAADLILVDVLDMPATIELCTFAGKLSAVLDVLISISAAGVPVHAGDEAPHELGGRE